MAQHKRTNLKLIDLPSGRQASKCAADLGRKQLHHRLLLRKLWCSAATRRRATGLQFDYPLHLVRKLQFDRQLKLGSLAASFKLGHDRDDSDFADAEVLAPIFLFPRSGNVEPPRGRFENVIGMVGIDCLSSPMNNLTPHANEQPHSPRQ